MLNLRYAAASLIAAATCLSIQPAHAQEAAYPSRPVTIVVPFSAGGALDIVARLLAERLRSRFGQSFIVENRPGAGGTAGITSVMRTKPDGYTLLVAATGQIAIAPAVFKNLNFHPLSDLTPVSEMTAGPLLLATSPEFKGNTVGELVRMLKENPDKYNYASTGNGTIVHLAAELFKQRTDTQVTHIPYAGGPQASLALMRGDALFTITNMPNILPHLQGGKLKGLAVTGLKRAKALPQMPTLAESGFPDFDVTVWIGLFGPKELPSAIVAKLNAAVAEAMRDPEIIKKLALQGDEPATGPAEEFTALLQRESNKWGGIVKSANIVLD